MVEAPEAALGLTFSDRLPLHGGRSGLAAPAAGTFSRGEKVERRVG